MQQPHPPKIALITARLVGRPSVGFTLRLYQQQTVLARVAPGRLVVWELEAGGPASWARIATDTHPHQYLPPRLSLRWALRTVLGLGLHAWPRFAARSLGAQREPILRWLDAEHPTHAVLLHPEATELATDLRRRGIRVIVDAHNVESDLARQLVGLAPTWALRLAALERWCVIRRWERRYFPGADEVWVPSDDDAARYRRRFAGRLRVRTVPNAVDVARYDACPDGGGHDIVLPAAFGYPPNVFGARVLRDRVLPAVRRAVPDARLVLVGRDELGLASALRREPDVLVTGPVADTSPYLNGAGVVAVPILHGGGTRFKILEAFACGRPVVSTPLGCEGLQVRDGDQLLVRDIARFPEAITAILTDPALGRALGRCGRRLVEQQYSLETIEAIIRQAVLAKR